MNFDFSEDQKFVQKTARDYLAEHSGLEVCRAVVEGGKATDAGLWKGVAEMGWLGAVVPEEFGGAGLGYLELALIAEEVGRALAPIPFSPSVYLATEAVLLYGSDAQKKKYLPRLASGDLIGTFALDEGPGDGRVADVKTKLAGGRITGTKIPVAAGDLAGLAVVVAQGDGGPCLALVELDAQGVTRKSVGSFDPSRSQAQIELANAPAELLGAAGKGAENAAHLLDRAALLMAFEQIGGADRAFEITREFTMGRYAFGRPIASFQVLKHRMADVFCAIEIARSNAYYGAWALSTGNAEELAVAAPSSRVAASDAFTLASEEMIQMHGGVGFTWEYDCHLFYRRARVLAQTIGSPSAWRETLVSRLEKRKNV
jgi:hypothetical protein